MGARNPPATPKTTMNRICIALVLTPLALSLPAGKGAGTGVGWELVNLDLEVALIPEIQTMAVEGTVRLRLEGGSSVGPLLGMNAREPLMSFVELIPPDGARVIQDVPVPDRPHAAAAQILFSDPCSRGDEIELSFVYESQVGAGSQFRLSEEVAYASWVVAWYPFLIDLSRSNSELGSAAGTTRFHLPPGWDVLSNGRKVSREEEADGVIVTWEVDVPVSRSFAAGPYSVSRQRVGEREMWIYLLSAKPMDVKTHAETLGAALVAQEERFGPYPYASYGIAELPDEANSFYASSEQGFIMARSGAFEWEHGNLPLWSHEMAHGWWGNLVGTKGSGSILCDESLAQYSAVIAIEAIEGREAATEFLRFSRSGYSSAQCARGYFDLWRAGTDKPLSELGGGGWMHTLADAKGHWFYHMLRRRVGDEVFFAGLRELIVKYAGERMSLDDLRAHFQSLAPDAELETFFAQWLDRTGAPILDLEWSATPDGMVEATINQVQEGEPYHLELAVAVDGSEGTRTCTVELRERETHLTLQSAGTPSDVRLDPEHALLIWTPEYGSRPE
jgi:hypothetical protein